MIRKIEEPISDNQDIPVEFPDTTVGYHLEIIGVQGEVLGFKDSFQSEWKKHSIHTHL